MKYYNNIEQTDNDEIKKKIIIIKQAYYKNLVKVIKI